MHSATIARMVAAPNNAATTLRQSGMSCDPE
jgi:hypothetical protein